MIYQVQNNRDNPARPELTDTLLAAFILSMSFCIALARASVVSGLVIVLVVIFEVFVAFFLRILCSSSRDSHKHAQHAYSP